VTAPEPFDWGESISSYSRAQAIEDGELVDVTPQAARRFVFPVAMTSGAFHECCGLGDDATARLGFVLEGLRAAIRSGSGDRVTFACTGLDGSRVNLWSLCGPGDTPEPVITIMLQGED
jgi:hypothetical protein